jgi:glycosyltransferase involved in cell wall biosynthesis
VQLALFTDTPRFGGAERVLEDLASAALAASHEVLVLAPQAWLLERVAEAAPGVRTRRAGDDIFRETGSVGRRAIGVAAQLPGLARLLRAERPDVLHVSNGGYPGSDICRLALIAGHLARVPRRLLTVHAVPKSRVGEPPGQRVIDASVWRATHGVIGATRAVEEALTELRGMPPELFVRIPYGVRAPDGAAGAAAVRSELRVGDDEVLVGMVSATSDTQKGHGVFVDAVGAAPGIRAAIIGAPPPADVLEQIERGQLSDRIAVMGRVDAIGAVYHALDAVVVPSVADESLPLVVLEAMACGKPVIASRLSGIPEAVVAGETGALFEPGDAAGLAALLAAGREQLAAWGEAGRLRWSEHYSVGAMTASVLALYS